MKFSTYQIGLALISLIIIVQRIIRFIRREHAQSIFKLFTVIFVWGGIGAIALFPSIAHFIRSTFGFGENFNTMIFIAFVILFVLFFKILSIIEKIENSITEIVRKEALGGMSKKNKEKKSVS